MHRAQGRDTSMRSHNPHTYRLLLQSHLELSHKYSTKRKMHSGHCWWCSRDSPTWPLPNRTAWWHGDQQGSREGSAQLKHRLQSAQISAPTLLFRSLLPKLCIINLQSISCAFILAFLHKYQCMCRVRRRMPCSAAAQLGKILQQLMSPVVTTSDIFIR